MPRDKPARSNRRSSRPAAGRGRSSAPILLLGVLLGLLAAFAALWLYHRYQRSTVPASRTKPAGERPSAAQALHPAQPRTTPAQPASPPQVAAEPEAAPFGISEVVFESGARLYSRRCATCHGTPHHSAAASHPTALQLWRPNRIAGGTGVGHQTPAQIHRSIAEGQPTAGMPAYRGVLTSTELWQLSLLLQTAGQDLPDPVLHLLDGAKP